MSATNIKHRPVCSYSRRRFLKKIGAVATALSLPGCANSLTAESSRNTHHNPNIILCMTDDQGWGDTGYNGHPVLQTPNLDDMAHHGLRFDRFYAAAPVCSPTRGSCLTGRHPYRYGIFFANSGHIKKKEISLAEALKTRGYLTGHFGKWHLGTLTKTERDANRGGPRGVDHYSPPWDNGFDVCFSTEAKVPTWDPMITPNPSAGDLGQRMSDTPFGTFYWTGPGQKAIDNLRGDDSRIIMDRAVPFIRRAAREKHPFFAVIWFHAPHLPVLAGPAYRGKYPNCSLDEQHFYGCITALDEQIGRLRSELRELGIAKNTLLWFCSDNGPEGKKPTGRTRGTTAGLRGRKRSLFEGGIRVPGLLEWPIEIKESRRTAIPCCTSDYFPTILDLLGFRMPNQPLPIDGLSLRPLIEGMMKSRSRPLAFESRNQIALIDNRYKLISTDKGKTWMLFDLVEDPGEIRDRAATRPDLVAHMKQILTTWQASCRDSLAGKDYA